MTVALQCEFTIPSAVEMPIPEDLPYHFSCIDSR
jgi:hypothetical protein